VKPQEYSEDFEDFTTEERLKMACRWDARAGGRQARLVSGHGPSQNSGTVELTVDLLFATPTTRVATKVIERALVFAFSAGDTNRAFERVLEKAGCGVSSFVPDCFANDLFIEQFVERCLPVRANGAKFTPCVAYLIRVLTSPPQSVEETHFRQRLLGELDDNQSYRHEFERLYTELHGLRALLSAGDYSSRVDQNVRRLDILKTLAKVFRMMAASFEGAHSGLCRITEAGQLITASPAFARLEELLQYERHLATVDVRLELGMEGRVRSFEVLGYQNDTRNPFYSSWLGRVWGRLKMILRGYHVTQEEVLSRLMHQMFESIKDYVVPLFQLLGDMEFYLAGLGFADMGRGSGFEPCFPELVAPSHGRMHLEGLYNPFLLAEGVDVRPCSISAEADAIVVVTGPNSGGKTRLLQSVAFCQMLAQAGMMVPARRAQMVLTRGLFVSLLNDVRADQHEGRLGMELLRIRRLFEQINVGDMVVIDELCSGTNPSEGEEIFRLVIELLGQLKPQIWLTTHFLQFADRLREDAELPQLRFLRVKLDASEHPTFDFEEGVAKTSLARQTAARLGVTWDELTLLVERAKERGARPRPSVLPTVETVPEQTEPVSLAAVSQP
jgi:DNA mismatch repair protein MutS2